MSSLTSLFTSLANKIRSKTGSEATMTPYDMIDAIDDVYDEGVAHGGIPTQAKTVTATTAAQTVTPDAGYALSSVTVNPQVHSSTYTYASGSTGATVDLGEANTYRYVNAANVYAKGKADGLPATFSIALNAPGGTRQNGVVVLPKELLSGYTTFTATLSSSASVQFGYITNYSYLYPANNMSSGVAYTISWGASDLGLAFKFTTTPSGVTYIAFS